MTPGAAALAAMAALVVALALRCALALRRADPPSPDWATSPEGIAAIQPPEWTEP